MDADDAPAAVPMDDDDDEEKDDDEPPSPAAPPPPRKSRGASSRRPPFDPLAAGVTASGRRRRRRVHPRRRRRRMGRASSTTPPRAATCRWTPPLAQLAPDGSLPLDADDTLRAFPRRRARRTSRTPGTVFLFGRVPVDASATGARATETVSACAVVTGMQRCMFVVPRPGVFDDADGEMDPGAAAAEAAKGSDEAAAKKARGALLRTLQMRAKDVKDEVREILLARGIESFTMKPSSAPTASSATTFPAGASTSSRFDARRRGRRCRWTSRAATSSRCSARRRPRSSTS